jgi:hypothetical protein
MLAVRSPCSSTRGINVQQAQKAQKDTGEQIEAVVRGAAEERRRSHGNHETFRRNQFV